MVEETPAPPSYTEAIASSVYTVPVATNDSEPPPVFSVQPSAPQPEQVVTSPAPTARDKWGRYLIL